MTILSGGTPTNDISAWIAKEMDSSVGVASRKLSSCVIGNSSLSENVPSGVADNSKVISQGKVNWSKCGCPLLCKVNFFKFAALLKRGREGRLDISSKLNLENVEEGEGPRSSFSKSLNISPTVVNKAEAFELLSPRAKQRQCVGALQASRGNIQSRASCLPKEGFYKEIALF